MSVRARAGLARTTASPRVRSPAHSGAGAWSRLGNRARGELAGAWRTQGADLGLRRFLPTPSRGELGTQPDPYVRALLQSAVGRDLGDVRIHTGPGARAALEDLGTDAAASGNRVAISPEHDRPTTLNGRALLLHELVHVLQQRDASMLGRVQAESADALERDARATAVQLVARAPLPRTS